VIEEAPGGVDVIVSSVARTEKQNIAQFSPKIAQNVARRN
jgi:hypothetical protein